MSIVRRALAALGFWSEMNLGRRGERLAARMLRRSGYVVLAKNVRVRTGEADLVCLAPDRITVVVVEVKTRLRGESVSKMANIVAPEANVHAKKRRKLIAVTRSLIRANGWIDRPVRIDVVAIEWPDDGGPPVMRHHVGAVHARNEREVGEAAGC